MLWFFVAGASTAALAAPPANDDFTDAKPVAGSLVTERGTTAEATREPGEPIHFQQTNADQSVWYAWTVDAAGTGSINACSDGEHNSGVLGVAAYTGSRLDALTQVGADQCKVTFPVIGGTTYWIAVGGHSTDPSEFDLVLDLRVTPLNDDFVDAEPIVGESFTGSGTTLWATKETGEPSHSTSNPYATKSVWYSWTAPKSGAVNINAADGKFNVAAVAAYTGNAVNSLTLVNRGYNTLTFTAAKNTTYRIALAGDIAFSGPFPLKLQLTPSPERFTLTSNTTGNGTGTITATPEPQDGTYPEGTTVTLTATPNENSTFTGWTGCDQTTQTGNCLITMTADKTITAEFTQTPTPRFTLTSNTTGNGTGTITATPEPQDGTYPEGTTVTLTATPNENSTFTGWTGCDQTTQTGNCLITMTADKTITAEFGEQQVVRPPEAKFGAISIRPKQRVARRGKAVTMTATLRNVGQGVAENVKICVKAPARVVKVKRCQNLGAIGSRKAKTRKFQIRVLRKARKGRRIVIQFTGRGRGVAPVRGKAFLKPR